MPSAPRFLARKTSAMPPAPRRRTISNWAISSADAGAGAFDRERTGATWTSLAPGATSLHALTSLVRPSWAILSIEPTRARPRAARSRRRRLLICSLYVLDKKLSGTIELLAPDKKRGVGALRRAASPRRSARASRSSTWGGAPRARATSTRTELDALARRAAKRRRGPRLHGELLVEKGAHRRAQLRAGLREQLVRKLRYVAATAAPTRLTPTTTASTRCAGWGGRGRRGIDPVPDAVGHPARVPPWEHVDAALAQASRDRPLRLAKRRTSIGSALGTGRARRGRAASRHAHAPSTDRRATAEPAQRADGQLLAYLLLVTKQVDVLPVSRRGRSRPARSSAPAPRRPLRRAAVDAGALEPRAAPPVASARSRPCPIASNGARPGRGPPGRPGHARAAARHGSPELAARWKEIVERAAQHRSRRLLRDARPRARRRRRDESRPRSSPSPSAGTPTGCPRARRRARRVLARLRAHERGARDADRRRAARALHEAASPTAAARPRRRRRSRKVIEAVAELPEGRDLLQAQRSGAGRGLLPQGPRGRPDTQADYLALLAWLTSLKPENQSPEKTAESIKMLDKAIAMNDRCEKAYFWRGMLYKRARQERLRGAADFKQGGRPQPEEHRRRARGAPAQHAGRPRGRSSSPPANRRSSPVPSKPPKAEEKSGLLGRFFKK